MIFINGKAYQGDHIRIVNSTVKIDEVVIEDVNLDEAGLRIEGHVETLECDVNVTVIGRVDQVTAGGNVHCDGVRGNVVAGGSVTCDDVGGDVQAGRNVHCDDVGGAVEASGSSTRD